MGIRLQQQLLLGMIVIQVEVRRKLQQAHLEVVNMGHQLVMALQAEHQVAQ